MTGHIPNDEVNLKGRSDPANKCAFRFLCKGESAAYILIAKENEKLRAHNTELARLLGYAAKHSNLAPMMNDSWREDSLTALEQSK